MGPREEVIGGHHHGEAPRCKRFEKNLRALDLFAQQFQLQPLFFGLIA